MGIMSSKGLTIVRSRFIGLVFAVIFSINASAADGQETTGRVKNLTLRLLIWEGYAPEREQAVFISTVRRKYNIKLKLIIKNASNPDDFFNALRKGEVEMISPAHNLPKDSRYNLTTNGLTLPIDLNHVPNYRHIAEDLRHQPWAMENGEVFAVPVLQGPYGLAYNADILRNEPKSWNILWDPRYSGRYMVSGDYYELSIYISALALGYKPDSIFSYDTIKGDPLEERIRQLAVNAHSFWTGFDKAVHFKGKVLATSWRSTFPELNNLGERWRIAVPQEGTTWWVDTLMIGHTLKNNPQLRLIAEEWINYLLEPVVQAESLALKLGIYPVTAPALILFKKKQTHSPDAFNQNRLLKNHIPWKVLKTRSRNAFSLLWKEALQARGGRRSEEKEPFPDGHEQLDERGVSGDVIEKHPPATE